MLTKKAHYRQILPHHLHPALSVLSFTEIHENTPGPGDRTFEVRLRLYGQKDGILFARTVFYTEYATRESHAENRPVEQKALEGLLGRTLPHITRYERTFAPGVPVTCVFSQRTATDTYRPLMVEIPAIPARALTIEGAETEPVTALRLKVVCHAFPEAVGDAMTFSFEVSGGPHDGKKVRIDAAGLPAMKTQIFLNPDAPAFDVINSLSDAGRLLSLMVREPAGGDGFRKAERPFTMEADGLTTLEIPYDSSSTAQF